MTLNLEELALSVDEAEWNYLRAHLNRGGLILINDSLNLVETAMIVASNNTSSLEEWINMGKI